MNDVPARSRSRDSMSRGIAVRTRSFWSTWIGFASRRSLTRSISVGSPLKINLFEHQFAIIGQVQGSPRTRYSARRGSTSPARRLGGARMAERHNRAPSRLVVLRRQKRPEPFGGNWRKSPIEPPDVALQILEDDPLLDQIEQE